VTAAFQRAWEAGSILNIHITWKSSMGSSA
jgi:hypothetical protein